MTNKELADTYGLQAGEKAGHFWEMKRGSKSIWIVTNPGCKLIQAKEGIVFHSMQWVNSGEKVGPYNYCWTVMVKASRVGEEDRATYTTGEVNDSNCKMNYPVSMAEKRAKCRAILDIAGLAKEGFFSVDDMTKEEWNKEGFLTDDQLEEKEKESELRKVKADDKIQTDIDKANAKTEGPPLSLEDIRKVYAKLINGGHSREQIDDCVVSMRGHVRLSANAKKKFMHHFDIKGAAPLTVAEAIQNERDHRSEDMDFPLGLEGGWVNWNEESIVHLERLVAEGGGVLS